jgi:acetyl-CoA carboxylase biotin carboxyl carrier protein
LSKKKLSNKNAAGTGTRPDTGPASPMNVRLLEQIIQLMAANDLNTVDLRDGDQRVVLKRGAATVSVPPVAYAPAPMSAPAPSSGMPASAGMSAAPPTGAAPDDESNLVPIKSPMVGTFYTASSPDAKPFVSVGSTVDDETDVCIIEAMKVFNNIKAETRGTIAKVLVSNGQTVEFGQTLFLVKP